MTCCKDVMRPIDAASCCTPDESVARAAQVMRNSGCGCAPVVEDRTSLQLIGVVTERDVCCEVVAPDRNASAVPVSDIMRSPSACCHEDDSTEAAQSKLHEHQATSLPVVNSTGGCCGTISSRSLASTQHSQLGHTSQR